MTAHHHGENRLSGESVVSRESFSLPHLDWLRVLWACSEYEFETMDWVECFGTIDAEDCVVEVKSHRRDGNETTTRIVTFPSLGIQVRHWSGCRKLSIDFQGSFWVCREEPYFFVAEACGRISSCLGARGWVTRCDIRRDFSCATGHDLVEMPDGDPRVWYTFLRDSRKELVRYNPETGEFTIRKSNVVWRLYRKDLEVAESLKAIDSHLANKATIYANYFEGQGLCRLGTNRRGQVVMEGISPVLRSEISLIGSESCAVATAMLHKGEIDPGLLLADWAAHHSVRLCPEGKNPKEYSTTDSRLTHWPKSAKFVSLMCLNGAGRYKMEFSRKLRVSIPIWDEASLATRLIGQYIRKGLTIEDMLREFVGHVDGAFSKAVKSQMDLEMTQARLRLTDAEAAPGGAGGPEAIQHAAAPADTEARVPVIPSPTNLEGDDLLKKRQVFLTQPRSREARKEYSGALKDTMVGDFLNRCFPGIFKDGNWNSEEIVLHLKVVKRDEVGISIEISKYGAIRWAQSHPRLFALSAQAPTDNID